MAKALRDFSRANPLLVIKGGLADGSLLSPADLAALADLPPREVLLARLAGALAAPMQQMAGLLQALPRNLAYGISALIEQREAGGETLPAATSRCRRAAAEPQSPRPSRRSRGRGRAADEADAEPVEAAEEAEAGRRRRTRRRGLRVGRRRGGEPPATDDAVRPSSPDRPSRPNQRQTEGKKGRPGRWQP